MCRMLGPRGPLGTCLHPQGHGRPGQLVCFRRSSEPDWADLRVQAGGKGYIWAAVDRGWDRL